MKCPMAGAHIDAHRPLNPRVRGPGALAALLAALVAACATSGSGLADDDDDTFNPTTAGSGSGGAFSGGGNAGTGADANAGGWQSDSGVGGQSSPTSGSGGGSPQPPPNSCDGFGSCQTCLSMACAQEACSVPLAACFADPSCMTILQCAWSCDDETCVDACSGDAPPAAQASARAYFVCVGCEAQVCSTDCTGIASCME